LAVSHHQVPIFVSARTAEGKTRYLLLPASQEDDGLGPFYCLATTPNGREVEGEVARLHYDDVLALFHPNGRFSLAVDEGVLDSPSQRPLKGVGLELWAGGHQLDEKEISLEAIPNPRGTVGIRIPSQKDKAVDHVQCWSEPGAVTVTSWPAGGSLFPVPGLPDAQRRIRPVVLGADPQCTAYWGFFRHSATRAVRLLGAAILDKATDPATLLSPDELIIAAHHALSMTRPGTSVIEPLVVRLRSSAGSDNAILLWAILFDELIPVEDAERRRCFEETLIKIAEAACLYTAVFRHLIQRLGDGEIEWREHRPPDDPPNEPVESALRWVKQLAQATYWDTDYLTYRAVDPRHPDAAATDAMLGIGAKKKSARRPFAD